MKFALCCLGTLLFIFATTGRASAQTVIRFGPASGGFNGGSITFTSTGNGTVDISLAGMNGGIFPSLICVSDPVCVAPDTEGFFSLADSNLSNSGGSISGSSLFSFADTFTGDYPANPSTGIAPASLNGNIFWEAFAGCQVPTDSLEMAGTLGIATSSGFFSGGGEGATGHTIFVNGQPYFATFQEGHAAAVQVRTDLSCGSFDALFDAPAGTTLTTQVQSIDLVTPEPASIFLLSGAFLLFLLPRPHLSRPPLS